MSKKKQDYDLVVNKLLDMSEKYADLAVKYTDLQEKLKSTSVWGNHEADKVSAQAFEIRNLKSTIADLEKKLELTEKQLAIAVEALDQILEVESIPTTTDDDEETEWWVNVLQANSIKEEALEAIAEIGKDVEK